MRNPFFSRFGWVSTIRAAWESLLVAVCGRGLKHLHVLKAKRQGRVNFGSCGIVLKLGDLVGALQNPKGLMMKKKLLHVYDLAAGAHAQFLIFLAKVVFLNERPQSRPFRCSGNICSTCESTLQDPYHFCSLSCKII